MTGLLLGLKDVRHDSSAFVCFVIALVAVLVPLLLLFAMKNGIVTALLDEMRQNPDTLELRLRGNYGITHGDYEALTTLPGIGFIVPAPRTIASRVMLESSSGLLVATQIIPSASGDPLLGEGTSLDSGEIAVSERLAARLQVDSGDEVDAVVQRQGSAAFLASVPLKVAAILPPGGLAGERALVTVDFADAVEAFLDGYAVPGLGDSGRPLEGRSPVYETIRLYAASMDDVAPLHRALAERDFMVHSAAQSIEDIRQLDRNLRFVFGVIAAIGGTGYLFSLAVNLWSNVERKRVSLSMLRLMGIETRQLMLFPLAHAAAVTVFGVTIAVGLYQLVAELMNRSFADSLPSGASVAVLELGHVMAALGLTLSVTILAALASSFRISRLQPMEALRAA